MNIKAGPKKVQCRQVSLFHCCFQIHVLNDISRGATIEAVISRMKTIQAAMGRSSVENFLPKLRFVAVSATIPNIDDVSVITNLAHATIWLK